ncbi:MAG: phosphoribosylglycinamide formyltransferase [Thermoplasmata archaeon]
MLKLGVLASGRGTDFQSLIDAQKQHFFDAEIVVLVSNNPEAYAVERARQNGIPAYVIPHKGRKREEHEREITAVLEKHGVELVVLAGYMRTLTKFFIERWRNRIINIHPALLPLFGGKGYYGMKVHEAVLASGMKVSGCTVHFVTEEIDGGPIILQKCVEVKEDDTPETLAARVLEKEHEILPLAVKLIAEGRVKIVDGKRVKIEW